MAVFLSINWYECYNCQGRTCWSMVEEITIHTSSYTYLQCRLDRIFILHQATWNASLSRHSLSMYAWQAWLFKYACQACSIVRDRPKDVSCTQFAPDYYREWSVIDWCCRHQVSLYKWENTVLKYITFLAHWRYL